MSEVAEVVKYSVDEILKRFDAIAAKLGIATDEIWRFTVAAMRVDARRDLMKGIARLTAPLFLWAWTIIVWKMQLPHDQNTYSKDLTVGGYALGLTAIVSAAVGLIVLYEAIEEIIDAIANQKTVEYDAFQDLIGDLKRWTK